MKGRPIGAALGVAGWMVLSGCAQEREAAAVDAEAATPPADAVAQMAEQPLRPELREEFVPIVQEIARVYKGSYRVVNPNMKFAPTMCRPVSTASLPIAPWPSRSGDESTHGRKLYYLYASDAEGYLRYSIDPSKVAAFPVGTTIVKESWTAEPSGGPSVDPRDELAMLDDAWFSKGDASYLFVMTRLEAGAEGTDDGWIYATVTPTMEIVTGAGRLDSCMECHRSQPTRVFGLPPAEAESVLYGMRMLGR